MFARFPAPRHLLAGALAPLVASCIAAPPPRAPEPLVAAPAPALEVPLEREVRYYRDETGAVWDDRGRKLDRVP